MNAFLIAAALTMVPAQSAPSLDNRFDDALGVAGLSTKTARFDPGLLSLYGQGEFATVYFSALQENPWRTPFYMEMTRRALAAAQGDAGGTLSTLTRLTGLGSRRALLGSPIARAEELSREPDAFKKALSAMKSEGLLAVDVPAKVDAPASVRQAAALILYTALDTVRYRRAAFSRVDDLDEAYDRQTTAQPNGSDPQVYAELVDFYRSVDMNYLYAASQDVATAVEKAVQDLQAVSGDEKFGFQIDTSWGQIVLSGGGDSTRDCKETLLCIDTGGDDVYYGAASNDSVSNWLSVCIDTNGNDQYVDDRALLDKGVADWDGRKNGQSLPGTGSATFGLSYLWDSRGSDLYRTHKSGIGSASFGVAMVVDKEGDDVYDCYANAEGYGMFGVGVLEDEAGNDKYAGFTQVQGIGMTAGVGALIDRTGNDTYSANDTVIDFPSPQSDKHNVSMAQGAGFGVRSDYLTGHSLSGGIGILYDQAGDDSYDCGVFGQGTGYWQSAGILWDDSGTDKYHGMWYVQGAAAHYAVGYLEDLKGDDTYVAEMNMAQGAGHDFSIGYLLDHEGSDSYQAPNLSLGAGNANGIGVFVDFAGDDTYTSSGLTLGKASESTKGSMRERALCLGVFLDLGGNDKYPASAKWAKNGARVANWTDKGPYAAESQVGVFWDGESR